MLRRVESADRAVGFVMVLLLTLHSLHTVRVDCWQMDDGAKSVGQAVDSTGGEMLGNRHRPHHHQHEGLGPTADKRGRGNEWEYGHPDGGKGQRLEADTPAAQRLQFSWKTVPIFQQLCNPNATLKQAFPEERMKLLATRYPLITLEHCQGYYSIQNDSIDQSQGDSGAVGMEDYFLSAASQLKFINPNLTVLFYTNSVAGLDYYRWCAQAFKEHPEWQLKNSDGDLCRSSGGHMLPSYSGYCWDQRQAPTQQWWASLCANLSNAQVTANSQLDGCFIDVAGTCLKTQKNKQEMNSGRLHAVSLAQQLAGRGYIVGAVGARPEDNVQLSHIYTFGPTQSSLDWLNRTKQAGMIAEAHAQTELGNDGYVNASLATFLIGAYEKSYFAFSYNPGAGYHPFCDGTAPTWCAGMGWTDDFAKPLGEPLSDAVITGSGMHFERQFSSGTNVTLDLQAKTCEIRWSDGSITVCNKF